MAANGQRVRPAAVRATTHLLHSPRSSSPACTPTPPPPSPCRSQSFSGHRVRRTFNPARVCYSLRHPLVLYRSLIGDRLAPSSRRTSLNRSIGRAPSESELNRSDGTELSSGNNFRRSFHGGDPDRRITAGGGRVRCSGVDKRRSRM